MGEHRLRQVPPSQRTMHLSLIAVWLGTALVSAIEHRGLSVQVLADAGIHAKVSQDIWDKAVAQLAAQARNGRLSEALAHAIRELGALLAAHFPRTKENRNELPNRVIEV